MEKDFTEYFLAQLNEAIKAMENSSLKTEGKIEAFREISDYVKNAGFKILGEVPEEESLEKSESTENSKKTDK